MDTQNNSYDYIVVGAGSAGCVVAARLSEDPKARVLLLEAGPVDRNPWIKVPIGFGRNAYNPKLSWNFKTEPCEGIGGRRDLWPRGKVLGGSSSINGLIYIRGQQEDYNHWRQLGNVGWSFEDVLPYFKKSEKQQRGSDEFHGTEGNLGVSDHTARDDLAAAMVEAAQQSGLPLNADFNGATQEGVGYYQLTTYKGQRSSTARAFLDPARSRGNLTIVTEAQTLGLEIHEKRVTGVRYRHRGRDQMATARSEVVLSAGAIGSPQILQLSGIGPGALLQQHGIAVTHELSGVGGNLQDHLNISMIYKVKGIATANQELGRLDRQIINGLNYLLFRKGWMTIGAGQVGIFAKTRPELATPDVQYHHIPFSMSKLGTKLHPFPAFTLAVCQLRPESRGHVTIKSNDPLAPPAIQPNFLAAELDRVTLREGVKLGREICAAPALQKYILREFFPGREIQEDADLDAYVRQRSSTVFHPVGTCKMGPDGDAGAVVDEKLRLRGLAGLRVADASIMPTLISGNTNATSIMIGEKAADLIRAAG